MNSSSKPVSQAAADALQAPRHSMACPYPTDSIRCSQGRWRLEKWSFRLRGSERFSISAKKNLIAYPEKYSRYKDLFRKVIRPCCLELTGMTDICVKSVEPIGGNWEKAPSLKVATKFVVERQPVSLRIPKLCIGEITPCDDAAMGTAYQQVEICA